MYYAQNAANSEKIALCYFEFSIVLFYMNTVYTEI